MPYINLKTNVEISDKAKLLQVLGELITILPGKTVARTMVSVEDKVALCFAGSDEPCAIIETIVNPESVLDGSKDYCMAVINAVQRELNLPEKRIYATVAKVDCWCSIK